MADDKYLDSLFERVEALEGNGGNDFDKYVLATDADFSRKFDEYFEYVGSDEYVIVPAVIQGITNDTCYRMFRNGTVKGVALEDSEAILTMERMFYQFQNDTVELKYFLTSNVKNMDFMFYDSNLTTIDLSSFDTQNLTSCQDMFNLCDLIEELDLSNFITTNITTIRRMFRGMTSLLILDISNFTHESVSVNSSMFENINPSSIIYVKNTTELAYWPSTSNIPVGVTFQIK